MKLTVYVAAYCDWGINLDDITLLDQQLAGFVAEVADGGFRDGLAGAEIGDGAVEEVSDGSREGEAGV